MSVRLKMIFAFCTLAVAAPMTSFAHWVPDNTEQGGTEVNDSSIAKSRAQVLEELALAKADPTWETRRGEATGVLFQANDQMQTTRALVRQELKAQTSSDRAFLRSFYTGA